MIQIIKFDIKALNSLEFIEKFVSIAYEKTHCKFSIEFNGSKGYLSNIAINAEGPQAQSSNIILIEMLKDDAGKLKAKMITVYHCQNHGVLIEINEPG